MFKTIVKKFLVLLVHDHVRSLLAPPHQMAGNASSGLPQIPAAQTSRRSAELWQAVSRRSRMAGRMVLYRNAGAAGGYVGVEMNHD